MNNKGTIKKIIIFSAVLALCTVLGAVFGHLVSQEDNQKLFKMFTAGIKDYSIFVTLPIYALGILAVCIIQLVWFSKGKKAEISNDDDDSAFDELNKQLERPVNLSNIAIIIMCILFAIIIESTVFTDVLSKTVRVIISVSASGAFIAMYIFQFFLTRSIVEYIKKLNPEKQGDMLDMNFQSRWLSSFDESEKYMAYKCGFNAYKNTNYACMIMWVLAFISQFMFQTGVMPVICIGIIWFILTYSYISEAKRIEENGLRQTEE